MKTYRTTAEYQQTALYSSVLVIQHNVSCVKESTDYRRKELNLTFHLIPEILFHIFYLRLYLFIYLFIYLLNVVVT